MRNHGTLIKWNDERGFGFISVAGGREEIFVHISAFPRNGRRPQLNELISFETETGRDGKRRAVQIMRPAQKMAGRASRGKNNPVSYLLPGLLAVLAMAAVGYYTYQRFQRKSLAEQPASAAPSAAYPSRCDGRTMCSQMQSCEEARFFIRNCPGTTMDGDNDGVPCESQWCQ